MEHTVKLYRKRLIPEECIPLKDDIIVECNDDYLLTSWVTLHPKVAFHHGASCFFLKEGIKVSKFYRADGSLLYWYCDVVEYEYREEDNSLIVTDLLADVIVYPDGRFMVADLDELAVALEKELLSTEQLKTSLKILNHLLTYIYKDKFDYLQAPLNRAGL